MMKFRPFISLKAAALCALVGLLSACGKSENTTTATTEGSAPAKTYKWKMVTSWPKNFPGLGQAPENFAKYVDEMSNGRLTVKVYGAGELVPGFEVFDSVSQGTVEMGHSGSYYWKGKIPAAPIFSAIPFGMNAQEMSAWLKHGGGNELWKELYKPFGIVPITGGNTGVQMAGWFKKEINSIDDLKGLKMRIPGLGGEVFKELGGVPVTLTGGEILTSLQTGAIDATEWVGPYNDLAFGLFKSAKYYYYSGWHEPGTQLEFLINEEALNSLPKDLQAIVKAAAGVATQDMADEYAARNNSAMLKLINEHQVDMRPLPEEVMQALKGATHVVLQREIDSDPDFARIYKSYQSFYEGIKNYNRISEQEYYKNR